MSIPTAEANGTTLGVSITTAAGKSMNIPLATMIRFLNRRASRGLRGRLIVYVTAGCVLLLFCGSLAILDAERRPVGLVHIHDLLRHGLN